MAEAAEAKISVEMQSRDPADVICNADPKDRPFHDAPRPKTSFEMAWDMSR